MELKAVTVDCIILPTSMFSYIPYKNVGNQTKSTIASVASSMFRPIEHISWHTGGKMDASYWVDCGDGGGGAGAGSVFKRFLLRSPFQLPSDVALWWYLHKLS